MGRLVQSLNSSRSPLHWLAFVAFLAIAFALRLAAFQGYSDSDPRAYSVLANDFAHGTIHIPEYDGAPVFPIRLGVYAPTAILIRFFGLSEATLVAYPFVISLSGCLLAYALTRYLESPLAGLIALGGLAVLPIELSMASLLFPDAIAAFWANIGVALALVALDRTNVQQAALIGFVSGIFFGVSWLCKESVVYLVPFVASLAFIHQRPSSLSWRLACVTAIGMGSLSVLLAEMFSYGTVAGDPLFRLHQTERNYEACSMWFTTWESGGYAKMLVERLFAKGPKFLLLNGEFGYLPTLAILGIAWTVLFQRRTLSTQSVWFISLMIMFNFMTMSFRSYLPMLLTDRYIYAIILPSLVILGGFLAKLLMAGSDLRITHERRFWATTVIAFMCLAIGVRLRSHMHASHPIERAIAARLGEGDVVYTDHRTAQTLAFFRSGVLAPSTDTTVAWENETRSTIPEGSYVLVNDDMLGFLSKHYKYTSPDFVTDARSAWEPVSTFNNAVLYFVPGE
jgi:4-amino-4-deoxy-L-arabinose transferase-like glycosyltransferase